jgi:hypothetical protein
MATRKKTATATATVLKLVPSPAPASSMVVDALTTLLERAKQGEIVGIAVAMHLRGDPSGVVSHQRAFGPDASMAVIVTALEWAKFDIISDMNRLHESGVR